jgi:hypothetical protein
MGDNARNHEVEIDLAAEGLRNLLTSHREQRWTEPDQQHEDQKGNENGAHVHEPRA